MFTGIITELGRIERVAAIDDGVELSIRAPESAPRLVLGASISINGVCQTVVALDAPVFKVQAVGATMTRTTFGGLRAGASVNLEPSLRVGDELGGHLVSGHVDGVGAVRAIERRGEATFLTVAIPADLARFAASRGSISIDGTSLTLAEARGDRVVISLIPHTLDHTIAGTYRVGDPVNIEVDLIARYLDRLLEEGRAPDRESSISMEILKEKFS